MKKIVFFDGDGTLWYPKSTKRTRKPHWIYYDPKIKKVYLKYLSLTPGVVKTLMKLRGLGMMTVVISTNPRKARAADAEVKAKVRHFGLEELVDEVHAARPVPSGKGAVIRRVLRRHGLSRSAAIIVGDSYTFDYLAAKNVGVEGLLMDTPYLSPGAGRVKHKIKKLEEIMPYVAKGRR